MSDKPPDTTMTDKDKEELKRLIDAFIMKATDYIQASASSSNALFVYGPDDDRTKYNGDRSVIALDRYVKAQSALEEAVNKFLKPSTPTTP